MLSVTARKGAQVQMKSVKTGYSVRISNRHNKNFPS